MKSHGDHEPPNQIPRFILSSQFIIQKMIERTFYTVPENKTDELEQQIYMIGMGFTSGESWESLLTAKRIMIISEAGMGKTYECQAYAKKLWDLGEASFYVELSALAKESLEDLLNPSEIERFSVWLSSQSEIATFFLDSIDELKISQGSFTRALQRLHKSIGTQLTRARIIITTRPVQFDSQAVRRILPIPPPEPKLNYTAEDFAQLAMGENKKVIKNEDNGEKVDGWKTVTLTPLSDEQIKKIALLLGVNDAAELVADLKRRNAQDFARRPQDLIELCADWRDNKKVRKHLDQVRASIRIKLEPRDDRAELAELSVAKATEGASRIALAMTVTRRVTIRHSAESDSDDGTVALDPKIILSDWPPNERKTLLERPLFGVASYGRVRFHHQSVKDFLAAQRLIELIKRGVPLRSINRLLFAETRDKTIVRPYLRPIAGWLALEFDAIFELLRDHEPDVLFNEGDPESLSIAKRIQALQAYVKLYGRGGWRGLSVPQIQIHRFASTELATCIADLWKLEINNPEIRKLCLSLIGLGSINGCKDIAYSTLIDQSKSNHERHIALEASISLGDSRIAGVAQNLVENDGTFDEDFSQDAIILMFPRFLSIEQFCLINAWMKQHEPETDIIGFQCDHLIENANLDQIQLEELRDHLVDLICQGLHWSSRWPHFSGKNIHLGNALTATCALGIVESISNDWLNASALALGIHQRDHGYSQYFQDLREHLGNLDAERTTAYSWQPIRS